MALASLVEEAARLGMEECLPFKASILRPELRIRAFCRQNLCGNYNRHPMCPPGIGYFSAIRSKLSDFQKGILCQWADEVNPHGDPVIIARSRRNFHLQLLKLEDLAFSLGFHAWALIGGSCALCEPCPAMEGGACRFPERARPSLESLGIDVDRLLSELGLQLIFNPDHIVWTGCLLLKDSSGTIF